MNEVLKTPCGLKIRLDREFCLKYIDRSNFIAWLSTIEAFDLLGVILSYIALIFLMFEHASLLYASMYIILLYTISYLTSQSSLLISLSANITRNLYKVYFFLSNTFLLYILIIVLAFYTKNLPLLAVYIFTRILCTLLSKIFDYIRYNLVFKKYDIFLLDIEVTALKLLPFFSNQNVSYKQLIIEYSNFLHKRNEK